MQGQARICKFIWNKANHIVPSLLYLLAGFHSGFDARGEWVKAACLLRLNFRRLALPAIHEKRSYQY